MAMSIPEILDRDLGARERLDCKRIGRPTPEFEFPGKRKTIRFKEAYEKNPW